MNNITDLIYSFFIVLSQVSLMILFPVLGAWYAMTKIRREDMHSIWFKRFGLVVVMFVIFLAIDFTFGSSIRAFLIGVFGSSGDDCPVC